VGAEEADLEEDEQQHEQDHGQIDQRALEQGAVGLALRGLVHAHFEEADRFALRVRQRNHAVQPDAVDVDDLADVRLARLAATCA
jgi:hypothetical protein